MTQSSLQTQCPKCETRFRVTDDQLSIAGGKVRCGNCMSVFNALEHRVIENKAAVTPAATPEPAGHPESQDASLGGDLDEEDLVFADNPEEDATEGRYAGNKLTFSDHELSDSFRSVEESEDPGFQNHDPDHQEPDVDESWAEAMLDEDAPRQSTPAPNLSKRQPDKPSPAPEPEPEALPLEPVQPAPQQHEAPLTAGDTLYQDLRSDPVSVGRGRSKLRTTLWTLVVLALLGGLAAQVVWFQFDRLSAIPQLRPFYEKGCEIAGCELKPLINVEAVQSRKLVVRTNPENRAQLIVDAVIVNRASFEQPFPAITLTFSNLNGDVVAQSIFTPDEYLAGEAIELETMPVETPVRIAISIRDPGRDAVNYNLGFRPVSR